MSETPSSSLESQHARKQELAAARDAFENLARELDELWRKPSLTSQEQKRVDLILNNATVAKELMEGDTPPEVEDTV